MRDSRCHILFLIPSLCGGGSERVVVTLLRHLDRTKFRPTLAVLDMRDSVYLGDVPEDVHLIDLKCSRVRYALLKIIRLIWKSKPHITFSTLSHLNLAISIIRIILPNQIHYIARESIIVSENIRSYRLSFLWRLAYRSSYSRFDQVVCQSCDMRDDLVEKFSFPSEKIVVINNPIDIERIRYLASSPPAAELREAAIKNDTYIYFVAAGRLSHQKGFDLLIEALALLHNPRLKLTILGEGPLRVKLERLVVAKSVNHQVNFAGFQKNPFPFFAQADAFILSSRFEGFPNVVLEALACGTPVIATPAPGGIREILSRVRGAVIAKAISVESLAEAIQSWLKSDKPKINPDAVNSFAVSGIVQQYQSIFLNNRAPRD